MSFMKILWIYIADSLVKTRIPFTKINFIKVSHSFKIEESLKRKKSQGIIEDRVIITRKYNAIQHAIKEAKSRDNIFVVDAMQPYEDVVLKIKKIIWEKI